MAIQSRALCFLFVFATLFLLQCISAETVAVSETSVTAGVDRASQGVTVVDPFVAVDGVVATSPAATEVAPSDDTASARLLDVEAVKTSQSVDRSQESESEDSVSLSAEADVSAGSSSTLSTSSSVLRRLQGRNRNSPNYHYPSMDSEDRAAELLVQGVLDLVSPSASKPRTHAHQYDDDRHHSSSSDSRDGYHGSEMDNDPFYVSDHHDHHLDDDEYFSPQSNANDIPCFECNVDYFGYDIEKIEHGVKDLRDCRIRCQNRSGCDFFSFVEDWGGCYLKHSKKGWVRSYDKKIVSGHKYCSNNGRISCRGRNITWGH